jgi:hypothetical protein
VPPRFDLSQALSADESGPAALPFNVSTQPAQV